MKKTYTRKELKAICNALNNVFWKDSASYPPGYKRMIDDEADHWIIELGQAYIYLKWNAEKQEFIV